MAVAGGGGRMAPARPATGDGDTVARRRRRPAAVPATRHPPPGNRRTLSSTRAGARHGRLGPIRGRGQRRPPASRLLTEALEKRFFYIFLSFFFHFSFLFSKDFY